MVVILDTAGNPVAGATVFASWSGATAANQSATTDSAGQASFKSGKVTGGGTFTITVIDVVKTGFTYTPTANIEMSDSITQTN